MFLSTPLPDQISFFSPPNRVNILMPHRLQLLFSLYTFHFMLNMTQSSAVCIALNKICARALQYIPIFNISLLVIHCHVNKAYIELWLVYVFKGGEDGVTIITVRMTQAFVFPLPAISSLLIPSCLAPHHTGETQASGVFLKVELIPCLINDWHLCQSIHSAATACNKSHLAGRWADPQSSPESLTSDKHGCLAVYQTDTQIRSIKQSKLALNFNTL